MKTVYRMEVIKTQLPKKMNWFGVWEEGYDETQFEVTQYESYFPSFEEMEMEIDKVTEGYLQYWADIVTDLHGANVESLEYHNGGKEWDREIKIETSRTYLTESLLSSIEAVLKSKASSNS